MTYYLDNTRSGYDALAEDYAAHIFDELKDKPLDRAWLDRFGTLVKPLGIAVDMGCGPGQVARYLHARGVPVMGVDLSPGMVAVARRLNPRIEFQTGNMLDLNPIPDHAWGGIAAFYSIIHIPPAQHVRLFGEFKRVLVPGGILLVAFHRGDGAVHPDELWGTPINIDFHHMQRAGVERDLRSAGFEPIDIIERAPYPDVEHQSHRVYIMARSINAPLVAGEEQGRAGARC